MNKMILGAAVAALFAGSAFAQGNSDRARDMADVLSGEPGIGRAAASISGKNAIGGDRSSSGWGNTGSAALAGGSVTEGAQSQGRGGRDGADPNDAQR